MPFFADFFVAFVLQLSLLVPPHPPLEPWVLKVLPNTLWKMQKFLSFLVIMVQTSLIPLSPMLLVKLGFYFFFFFPSLLSLLFLSPFLLLLLLLPLYSSFPSSSPFLFLSFLF